MSVAPRGGAFVLANMTNPPSPTGRVVGHNIDIAILVVLALSVQDHSETKFGNLTDSGKFHSLEIWLQTPQRQLLKQGLDWDWTGAI